MAKAAAKPAAKAKADTITTRQLGVQLAEKQELTNKQAHAILEDLTGLITKHLKKGARVRLNGLGILQVRNVLPAWAATLRPGSRSKSRPARRSHSVWPRN